MPPKRKAVGKAAAPPPPASSLLAVDAASLQKLSLPALKAIAQRANMEAAWSEISKQHRPDLVWGVAQSSKGLLNLDQGRARYAGVPVARRPEQGLRAGKFNKCLANSPTGILAIILANLANLNLVSLNKIS